MMEDADVLRSIGRLEEHARWVAPKIESIDKKLEFLLATYWKMTGIALGIGTLGGFIIRHLFK